MLKLISVIFVLVVFLIVAPLVVFKYFFTSRPKDLGVKFSSSEVESAIKKYHLGFNPSYYLKGKFTVTNNRVSIIPEIIQIGRVTIPQNLISSNLSAVTNFIEDRIKAVPNLNVRSLKLENGVVNIDATVPAKQYTVWG